MRKANGQMVKKIKIKRKTFTEQHRLCAERLKRKFRGPTRPSKVERSGKVYVR